jgi:hypothetical protein
MRRPVVTLGVVACAVMLLASSRATAQGTLGSQGFGYPPGQLSVFARSVGGAMAETDPLSPINPAALALLRRGGLYLQTEQENRRLEANGLSGSTRTYRFPLFAAGIPIGSRGVIGMSFSTLLDRTWGTVVSDKQVFGSDSISYVERFRSQGALNDVRVAGAYAIRDNLIVGLGLHLFPGENRLTISRIYADSLSFAALRDSTNVNYFGGGVSAGLLWRAARTLTVGASGRFGGTLKLRERDSLSSTADAPSRFGLGVRYEPITGTAIALRADRELWSKMAGLGSERATPEDTWDTGIGIDALGPRLIGAQLTLRVGARWRDLPFLASDEQVRETAYSFGLGSPFASGRAQLDFFGEHASRTAGDLDAKERSWTFGVGLTVKP